MIHNHEVRSSILRPATYKEDNLSGCPLFRIFPHHPRWMALKCNSLDNREMLKIKYRNPVLNFQHFTITQPFMLQPTATGTQSGWQVQCPDKSPWMHPWHTRLPKGLTGRGNPLKKQQMPPRTTTEAQCTTWTLRRSGGCPQTKHPP